MAVYLGSQFVDVTKGIEVEDRSIENSIVEGTIQSYENSSVDRVGEYAFCFYSSLQSIDLPMASYIGNYAFSYCTLLQSVHLSNVSYIGRNAFAGCYSLQSANLPVASYIGGCAFAWCYSLQSIDLPKASYIGGDAFRRCYKLLSLYLGSTSVCSLAASNAFTLTPIADYTTYTGGVYGSIYVPASLYSDYINATNWTVFSSRFVSI